MPRLLETEICGAGISGAAMSTPALKLAPALAPALRSISWPGDSRSGSSMPLAEAIDFQSDWPAAPAIDCSESPDLAGDSGVWPGEEGTLPSPWKVETRIFCWLSVRLMLALSGLPSALK